MNKSYKSVWNESRGTWVATSELTTSRGKRSKSSAIASVAAALFVVGQGLVGSAQAETAHYAAGEGAVAGVEKLWVHPCQVGECANPWEFANPNYPAPPNVSSTAVGSSAAAQLGGVALGDHAAAEAGFGVALGAYSLASGSFATAVGTSAVASGRDTTAVGLNALASADRSIVLGSWGVASGVDSMALGHKTTATGADSVALGGEATGDNGTAVGSNANASDSAVAIGSGAAASSGAVAVGQGAQATASSSVALGQDSVADRENTVSVGSAGRQRQVTNVAAGSQATDAVNVSQLTTVVDGLGGGASIDPTTGAVTGPSYQLSGGTYSNVGDALSGLDDRMNAADQAINDLARGAYSGIAAATALTMIPDVDKDKTLSIGIGGGTYKGYQAVAIGGTARITQNIKMKAGVGLSSGGTTVGVGASYQW
ncbi:YadA-like family protein [Paraburkholderia youngii]|uniref:Autotransporter adhesin n=1 Tax=Paraburkholderia youngii TaxID=2782701 RepID=A0A7W8LCI0_9BURK|nr:YadA-like family protein [Paraburkholderia youngii]MBB5404512.1 autotransporter adhesin [Paraburkholderia youngii]